MKYLNHTARVLDRAGRVLFVLSLAVLAGALSVTAAVSVLEYQRSHSFYDFASDTAVYYSDGSDSGVRTEMTTTVTQELTHISGTGSEPSEPLELLSEGLWFVTVRFSDYEPPDVGDIPTVNLNSVSGEGGAGWSGDWWTHIYVTADPDVDDHIGFPTPIPVFTPGEVVLHISDLPDDVGWHADFERIGELQPEK